MLQVAVHDRDKGRCAGHGPFDDRTSEAAPPHAVQALDAVIRCTDGFDLCGGAVGGIVIDEDHLPDDALQNRVELSDQLGDIGPLIKGGHHNGQFETGGRRRGRNRRIGQSELSLSLEFSVDGHPTPYCQFRLSS